jgi:hypothetical protein
VVERGGGVGAESEEVAEGSAGEGAGVGWRLWVPLLCLVLGMAARG